MRQGQWDKEEEERTMNENIHSHGYYDYGYGLWFLSFVDSMFCLLLHKFI